MERGYFAAEGLDAQLLFFDAGEPIAVATVSGDVDFGAAGISAGLYNLAGQGALRIIGGMNRDVPGFHAVGFFASNRAAAAGVTSMKSFGGHSSGVTTVGSTYHYALGLLEEKAKIDSKSVRVVPLQGMPNILSALTGGQVDTAVLPVPFATPSLKGGEIKLLGYTSDVAPWQMGVIWTATKTANTNPDRIRRFLRAYRKGGHDYFQAFTAPDGSSYFGPTAPEILAIIAKYTHQTVEQIKPGIAFVDPDARIDEADIANQITWFHTEDMVKKAIDPKSLIDSRYALPITSH
jgi:NitT/TauT family transport system substrate-binding protein